MRSVIYFGICVIAVSVGYAQQTRTSYDPGKGKPTPASPQSFVDFTLHQLNPTDKDYGKCLEESRVLAVDETIKSGYFWSNVVSLGLAICLIIIVIYQHRQRENREWDVAGVLQQYSNALARANTQVDLLTTRNHELAEALTITRESTLLLPVFSDERKDLESETSRKAHMSTSVVGSDLNSAAAAPKPGQGTVYAPVASSQMGLFRPEVDLTLKVNSLEQQLEHSQEQQKHLRRQLTQTDQRLQTERQKNRTLKGA